ncbi:MAG: glycerophosphodiester phosphodiesterase family protein [Eubacteriales bacterium]|nr:glycerophosphodiester phosphodiesterase family protein [Eubacteriales bacterium]
MKKYRLFASVFLIAVCGMNMGGSPHDFTKKVSAEESVEASVEEAQSESAYGKPAEILSVDKKIDIRDASSEIVTLTCKDVDENTRIFLNQKLFENCVWDYEQQTVTLYLNYEDYCLYDQVSVMLAQNVDNSYQQESNIVPIEVISYENPDVYHYDWANKYTFISHAGGSLYVEQEKEIMRKGEIETLTMDQEYHYTNSTSALDQNYEKGQRLFELDFSYTSDHVLIARHDWSSEISRAGDEKDSLYEKNGLPKSYQELLEDTVYGVMTFEEVCEWMKEHPEVYIVTDTKETGGKAVRKMFTDMAGIVDKYGEDVKDRIIVQVYSREMYELVRNIYPCRSVIYTLYQSTDKTAEVGNFVQNSPVKIITVSEKKFSEDLLDRVTLANGKIFIHTINDTETVRRDLEIGVSGFYTDSITEEGWKQSKDYRIVQLRNETDPKVYQEMLQDEEFLVLNTGDENESIPEYFGNEIRIEDGLFYKNDVCWSREENAGREYVVFDRTKEELLDIAVFEDGLVKHCRRKYIQKQENLEYLLHYLEMLQNPSYRIYISVMGDGGELMTDGIMERLSQLGVKTDLREHRGSSFLGIYENNEALYEEVSTEELSYRTVLEGRAVEMVSSGSHRSDGTEKKNKEQKASIKIEGKEYAMNRSGLNIAVWDTEQGSVISNTSFHMGIRYLHPDK